MIKYGSFILCIKRPKLLFMSNWSQNCSLLKITHPVDVREPEPACGAT